MILVDLNVVLDVVQRREPHYRASAAVLDAALRRDSPAALAAHAVTTLHYIIERYNDRRKAQDAVAWLLRHFEIAAVGRSELARALELGMPDYEDAVVAAAAEAARCSAIVTRNVKDFLGAPVHALTPQEFLFTGR